MPRIKRGEIWLADLGIKDGTSPGKIRPVLIVQSQVLLNMPHPSTLVVPLTSQLVDDIEPLRLRIPKNGDLKCDSDALFDQLRAIDNSLLLKGPLFSLDSDTMKTVDWALGKVLGISIQQPERIIH